MMPRKDAIGFRVGGSLGGPTSLGDEDRVGRRAADRIAVLRYVVKVEPMTSATIDDVVDLAAPSIRATLRA
jgi:hypothetical protein